MKKNKIFWIPGGLLLTLILVMLLSLGGWYFQPKKELDVFILNKTVATINRDEHKSFHWILNHYRYVKPNHHRYKLKEDYYGFFPTNKEKEQFDFKSISIYDVERISNAVDIAYFADTYGVYYSDWFQGSQPEFRSEQKVYGDLNQNDFLLLKAMLEKDKTIITEFVLLNKTTSPLVREKTEELLHFKWQGWIGRYFSSLDTAMNPNFPKWIVKLYTEQNHVDWDFKHAGIILIHKYGKMIILNDKFLIQDIPNINTHNEFARKYNLPSSIEYPYWFDVVQANNQDDVVASFDLHTNALGDSLLNSYNIPLSFPAIINRHQDYNLYYFAGDFCHNPVNTSTSFLYGIRNFDFLAYSEEKADRKKFFWEYYIPLIKGILEDTYAR